MEKLLITADYHSHTTYSHGKGSVADNARVASLKGLDFLAITDHAVRHPFIGVSRKKYATIRADIDEVQKSFPNLKILFGVEANLLGMEGDLDVTEQDVEKLDILIAGYHLTSFPYNVKDFFAITCTAIGRYAFKATKAQIARSTKMYVNAVKRNKIDIITHPGFRIDIDYFELGKVCEDYGTYVELSSRHRTPDESNIEGLLKSNCKFVLNSDAHKSDNVGECGFALDLVEKFSIPEERIANANHKQLVLRSKS